MSQKETLGHFPMATLDLLFDGKSFPTAKKSCFELFEQHQTLLASEFCLPALAVESAFPGSNAETVDIAVRLSWLSPKCHGACGMPKNAPIHCFAVAPKIAVVLVQQVPGNRCATKFK
jgi:hypothetical protein